MSRKNNKTRPFNSKNSARTTSENLENIFQKVKKMTCLNLKIVKIDPLIEHQNFTINFNFGSHISAFLDENSRKRWPLAAENNTQTSSEEL